MRLIYFIISILFLVVVDFENISAKDNNNFKLWDDETDEQLYGEEVHGLNLSTSISSSFNVGRVIKQVNFAFRENDNFFEGFHANYAVKVSSDGLFSVVPYYYENKKTVEGKAATFKTVSDAHKVVINEVSALEIQYNGMVEELKNTENGLEQSWKFAKKPEINGDLTIKVSVKGLEYKGKTKKGLHFSEKGARLGLRYGVGTWIDAAGRKTKVFPKWENEQILLTVPQSVIRKSAYPAVLDPIIGPEVGFDNPVYVPATGEQLKPDMVFDGTNFMIVWHDMRKGNYDIFATRVSKTGVVLDKAGIIVSSSTQDEIDPAIAFDGTNYMVVWSDANYGKSDIYGARIGQDGVVQKGFAVCVDSGPQGGPAITFDGKNYFVAWNDYRDNYEEIYGTRVDKTGTPLDKNGEYICDGRNPVISSDGTNYLLLSECSSSGDICGASISKSGVILNAEFIVIYGIKESSFNLFPSIAFDGTNYFVVWEDERNGNKDIYGTGITKDGEVISPKGIVISSAESDQESPSIVFDGTNYFVIWEDSRNWSTSSTDIYGARVTKEGEVLDVEGIEISAEAGDDIQPKVKFDGTNYLAVYGSYRNNGYNIYHTQIATDGKILNTESSLVSSSANNQSLPAVAFDGTNYLVVWEDDYNGAGSDIFGSRISKDGSILDINGFAISMTGEFNKEPSIAFDGEKYLVVWVDKVGKSNNIFGAFVTKSGKIDSSGVFPISTTACIQSLPKVVFGDTNYLVVWEDYRDDSPFSNIYGARVAKTGEVLDKDGIAIYSADNDQFTPSVAFNGKEYLVIWRDSFYLNYDWISGIRVATNGSILGKNITINNSEGSKLFPAIAFDGTNFLVVWSDKRDEETYNIYGVQLKKGGDFLDVPEISIRISKKNKTRSSVGFDGEDYIVVWQASDSNKNIDISSMKVGTDGSVAKAEQVISNDKYNEINPVIASSGYRKSIIAYSFLKKDPEYNSSRIAARLYDSSMDVEEPDSETSDVDAINSDIEVSDSNDNYETNDEEIDMDSESNDADKIDLTESKKESSGCSLIVI